MSLLASILYTWGKSGHKFASLALITQLYYDDKSPAPGEYDTEAISDVMLLYSLSQCKHETHH